jgi:hypothetical protein
VLPERRKPRTYGKAVLTEKPKKQNTRWRSLLFDDPYKTAQDASKWVLKDNMERFSRKADRPPSILDAKDTYTNPIPTLYQYLNVGLDVWIKLLHCGV